MSQGFQNRQRVSLSPAVSDATSRPRFLDYFLILLGSGLSMLLAQMSGLQAHAATEAPDRFLAAFLHIFPALLFLPLGILLWWPVFFTTQKIFGRKQGLTVAEWLWGLSWLVALFLTVWIVWKGLGTAPGFLGTHDFQKGVIVGYIIYALSMAVIAVIVFFVGLFGRWSQPWTHHFSLALMIWPAVPLLVLWLANIKLE